MIRRAAAVARREAPSIAFGVVWGSLCLLGGVAAAWWIDASLGGAPWP